MSKSFSLTQWSSGYCPDVIRTKLKSESRNVGEGYSGVKAPFTLTTYEPTSKGFGEFSLSQAQKDGKWTMLFFYPADYTFV
jgi:hypothetical protein